MTIFVVPSRTNEESSSKTQCRDSKLFGMGLTFHIQDFTNLLFEQKTSSHLTSNYRVNELLSEEQKNDSNIFYIALYIVVIIFYGLRTKVLKKYSLSNNLKMTGKDCLKLFRNRCPQLTLRSTGVMQHGTCNVV